LPSTALWLQLIQTYQSFGNKEIALAKKRILENQEILRKVKELQQAEQEAAEEHVLQALRKTVTQMQEVRENSENLRKNAEDKLHSAQAAADRELKYVEQQKIQEILSSIDMDTLLRGTEPDKRNKKE
jgi:uncharacterized protein YcbK (DUF882 family)